MDAVPEDAHADDVALVRRAAAGEVDAVRRLVDDIGPVVHGFVYVRVGGDESVAADLLQETLLETLRSSSSFRGESSLATWACVIARRRVARHFERERKRAVARRGLVLLHGGEAEPNTEPGFALEQRDVVARALGTLPALHRQVLVLKYFDGCSVEEIATQLGKGRVQVQSLLQRARVGLRKAMKATTDD